MTQPTNKRPALGRGLGALLPSAPSPPSPAPRGLLTVDIAQVHPERLQPRRHFDQHALAELAQSIRSMGLIQPLLVRRLSEGGYSIIAGERRWRAAHDAGLSQVPVIVKEVSDVEAFEVALIENIQRQDLNPIEEADAYHRLLNEYKLTQEDVARRIGKERSTVANSLRLLRLSPTLKDQVAAGALSVGHAKVLLALPDPEEMEKAAEEIVARRLSVRDAERLVARLKAPKEEEKARPMPPESLRQLADRAMKSLRRPVELTMKSDDKGSVVLKFDNQLEAEGLLRILVAGAAREGEKQ